MQTASWKRELAGILQEWDEADALIDDTMSDLRDAAFDLEEWIERHERVKNVDELRCVLADLRDGLDELDGGEW